MNKSIYRFAQSMVILGLATYLTEKWISGRLSFYINPRFARINIYWNYWFSNHDGDWIKPSFFGEE